VGLPKYRHVPVLNKNRLWDLTYVLKSCCIWYSIVPTPATDRLLAVFVVGLRILKNAIDMPVVVDDILVLVSLEWHSKIKKSEVDVAHT
jgi:hypothetical protein